MTATPDETLAWLRERSEGAIGWAGYFLFLGERMAAAGGLEPVEEDYALWDGMSDDERNVYIERARSLLQQRAERT